MSLPIVLVIKSGKLEQEIITLFTKYINRQCSPAEVERVIAIVEQGRHQAEWDEVLSQDAIDVMNGGAETEIEEHEITSLHERIISTVSIPDGGLTFKSKVIRLFPRIVAAACILICIGVGIYFYRAIQQEQHEQSLAKLNFSPGGNKAILTLADGREINLTQAENGLLASQGNIQINKTGDGQVTYHSDGSPHKTANYNTMSTPLGGKYHLRLADGTGVWLNAASSIKYPTAFAGAERRVEITGEVYFEVAHNAAKPFKVTSKGQMVEVLGTHFNINAYADEGSVKTTLLQGSVRVASNGAVKILKPGQQSAVNNSGILLNEVDVAEAVAWKAGYFDFTNTDIQTIMRQFSRWYNVDIQFEGPVTTETFTGKIPRSWNLSQVMKMVQSSKSINLTVEGRRIMIRQ